MAIMPSALVEKLLPVAQEHFLVQEKRRGILFERQGAAHYP